MYSVGDTGPAGGIIFYVNTNAAIVEWTYLEAAPIDLPGKYKWGGDGTSVNNTGTGRGSGEANTAAIVAALGDNGGVNYAAKSCSEYTVNHNGVDYDDWFLPSKDELKELYKQKDSVGGFASDSYWSSSEASSFNAWDQYFYDGAQYDYSKSGDRLVRAVRAF